MMAPSAKSWRTRFAIWCLTVSLLFIVSVSHEAPARISFASCSAVLVSWGKEFKHAVPIAHALRRFPNRERSMNCKDFWRLACFDMNDGTARLNGHAIVLAKNEITTRRLKQRHWLFIGG